MIIKDNQKSIEELELEEWDDFEQDDLLSIIDNNFNENKVYYEENEDIFLVTTDEDMYFILNKAKSEKLEALHIEIVGKIQLPTEIGTLTNLKKLEISSKLEDHTLSLPTELGKLENLEELILYHCCITELPMAFKNLKNLRILNLNDNWFEEFPKVLLQMKKLESLAINYKFEVLPDEICNLTNLKFLYLPNANIQYLPKNIGKLKNLEILCIWGTRVGHLPESCLKLTNLKQIYLTRSLFADILPPEIMKQSPVEVIQYIVRYQNGNNKIEVNESKLIIVGQGGVGKTCLMNRLINDVYNETVSTEGIDIATWQFEKGNKKYQLNVWDFGGQEIYHATHQFFLTKRSFYIFVWDARQEEEYGRIDYWLRTIESFADNSPIIIVVNKCDSRDSIKQLDLKSLKDKFPQVIDCFKVSCKENVGIEHLRNVIKEETTKLPLMGMEWFSSWLDVRYELEALAKTKNMITYTEYQQICRKYYIEAEEALSLSKYLHDLGIIINFQDDMYLKNIVILNPEWGTKAVYKVLDAQENVLKNRNGILHYDDLSKIWKDTKEYPSNIYPIILRLMENFQLSFEFKKNEDYLIAELLENEEINQDINFYPKRMMNFQYSYDFLPAGIMTRFIVKANSYLIEKNGKKACWKKGAYLKYGDAVGLVKLFDGIAERKIEIKVTGENRNSRELLVIIRKYFDEIHKSVPKINYTEYVKCNCKENCPYLHKYRYLLRLEEKNEDVERCQESLEFVKISRLLDGLNDTKKHENRRRDSMNGILERIPEIIVNNYNTNTNTNSLHNTITIEIRTKILELQGNLNDLKDEVVYENSELEREFEKIERSIDKLQNAQTKEELIKSGVLLRLKRFIDELQDNESEIGKVAHGIKHGIKMIQEIGKKYNCIAEWSGLPVIPKVFLK